SAPSAPSAGRAPGAGQAASAPGAPSAPGALSALRAPSAPSAPSAGYPALYGRFQGSRRPTPLSPPANTLALNPYLPPQPSVRPGQIPRGAQLLSTVEKAPGAGRDLYASPDGRIYRRKPDGWYLRSEPGAWNYFAPTQGKVERDARASAGSAKMAGTGSVYGPANESNAARRQARGDRVPDIGSVARDQEVAALEREYYARALAQLRVQNRPVRSVPSRGIGRRR